MLRKIIIGTLVVVLVLGGVLLSGQFSPVAAKDPMIFEFQTMVGIPQALTGTQNPIRGINGGGLPWMLTSANGVLGSSGKLVINVKGLVLAAGANAGKNPVDHFGVIVSCLTSDGNVDNVSGGLFPATTGAATDGGGDAHIQTTVTLPQSCIAPIIFLTSPGGAWFAATGH